MSLRKLLNHFDMGTFNTTYYDLLGVQPNATTDQIKAAYKQASMKFHPDRNNGTEAANELFKLINTAYRTLSDPDSRRAYDLEVGISERPPHIIKEEVPVYVEDQANAKFWTGALTGVGIALIMSALFGGKN